DSTDTPPPTPPQQGERRKQDNSVALLPILAHELAHLQHRDLHTLAATRLLLILLWPQPLFWLLRRTIRLDQETLRRRRRRRPRRPPRLRPTTPRLGEQRRRPTLPTPRRRRRPVGRPVATQATYCGAT